MAAGHGLDHIAEKKRRGWGLSSAGRAPAWHAGGQRFDPARLHQFFIFQPSNGYDLSPVEKGVARKPSFVVHAAIECRPPVTREGRGRDQSRRKQVFQSKRSLDIQATVGRHPHGCRCGCFRPISHGVASRTIRRIAIVQVHACLILDRPWQSRPQGVQLLFHSPIERRIGTRRIMPYDVDVTHRTVRRAVMKPVPYRIAHESCSNPTIRQI